MKVFVVGGFVRDTLLGLTPKDKDGCVGAYYHRYHPFGYCNGKTVLEAVCRIFVLERMRKTVTHPIEIVI
jgi:hypothetical protein